MNTKVKGHLQRATDLLSFCRLEEKQKFGGSDDHHYTKNALQELGFGSKVLLRNGNERREVSMQDFHSILRSARRPTDHPEYALAFIILCVRHFRNSALNLEEKFSWHSEMKLIRAFKAAMMISGMADEGNDSEDQRCEEAKIFSHDGIDYEYVNLQMNLKDLEKNSQIWLELDEHTTNEIIIQIEQELIRLLQTITREELRQIGKEEKHHLKKQSENILRKLVGCSGAYWKATVERQGVRGSVRQANRTTTASNRRRKLADL